MLGVDVTVFSSYWLKQVLAGDDLTAKTEDVKCNTLLQHLVLKEKRRMSTNFKLCASYLAVQLRICINIH